MARKKGKVTQINVKDFCPQQSEVKENPNSPQTGIKQEPASSQPVANPELTIKSLLATENVPTAGLKRSEDITVAAVVLMAVAWYVLSMGIILSVIA